MSTQNRAKYITHYSPHLTIHKKLLNYIISKIVAVLSFLKILVPLQYVDIPLHCLNKRAHNKSLKNFQRNECHTPFNKINVRCLSYNCSSREPMWKMKLQQNSLTLFTFELYRYCGGIEVHKPNEFYGTCHRSLATFYLPEESQELFSILV